MSYEIERKFLVREENIERIKNQSHESILISQGYIHFDHKRSVRIRLETREVNNVKQYKAMLCIKGTINELIRHEFEYEIPFDEGQSMFNILDPSECLIKKRYVFNTGNAEWTMDEFGALLTGLYLAEIEFGSEEAASKLIPPPFCYKEVTNDPRYLNGNLVSNQHHS